jgi:TRAP-type C4-dicarboxylate transport system substrate-binding protein
MHRRRRFAAAAGALVAFLAMPAAAQVTVKMSTPTINDPLHAWLNTYKDRIEKAAPGKLKGEVYPASQLGAIPRTVEGLQFGTIEVALMPPEFLIGVDKRYQVLGAPMLLDDMQHGYRATHHPDYTGTFWKFAEPKGIMTIGQVCDGESSFAFRTPFRTLDDFKGKKIRAFPSAIEREMLRRLGATAAPMPLDEVITGLQQGTIDGAKSGVPVFVGFKYQTASKYLVRTSEAQICSFRLMSKPWFDKLPADLQKVLIDAARPVDEEIQKLANEVIEKTYDAWVAGGGELRKLTAEERAELNRLLASVGEEVVKGDPELSAAYASWKRIAEATRKP